MDVHRRSLLLGAVAGATAIEAFGNTPPAQAALTADDQAYMDLQAVVAAPDRFPGIDPTGAGDSSSGLQDAINATPEGGTLVIPAGTYRIPVELYPRMGKSITVRAAGATLIQTTAKPIFSVSGTYDPAVSVTAIANAPADGVSNPITRLTVATAQSWSAGDVVKIVSDDVIPEGRPGDGTVESRLGEFAVVRRVSGTTVYLNGVLRETYKTGIRVARISRQTFTLEGGRFETLDSRMGQQNSAVLFFSQLYAPVVRDVHVTRASGPAIQMVSCFGYLVVDCEVGRAIDNTSAGLFGYGVLDNSSAHGQIRGGVYRHVRHAYTDDTNRVAANSDLLGYGRTFATKVIGVQAVMTTNAAFDTHHCSRAVEFIACTASGGANIGQGQSGFQLRGLGHRIIDGTVHNCDVGLQVLTESGGGESRGHAVDGLVVRNANSAALRVAVRPAGHPQALKQDPVVNLTAHRIVAEDCGSFAALYNANVEISWSSFRALPGAAGANVQGVYGDNSWLRMRDSALDFQATTVGAARPFSSGQTAGTVPGVQRTDLQNVEVRATAATVALTYGAVNGAQHILQARGLRFSYPFRYMPGEKLHPDSEYDWISDYVPGANPKSSSSSAFVFGNTDWTTELARITMSRDPQLFVRLNTTNNWTAPAFPQSRILGQTLTLLHLGVNGWTVKNGTAYLTALKNAVDRRLVNGDRMTLVWDGSIWREI